VRTPILALLFSVGVVPVASGSPIVYVVEPESPELYWTVDFLDDPVPVQRIRIRNDGDPAGIFEVRVPPFVELVDSGGDLSTGGEMFFDLRCVPNGQEMGDPFWLNWCANSCEDEGIETVWLYCTSGRLTPDSTYVSFAPIYQDEGAVASFSVANPRPEPITVDGVSVPEPFDGSIEGGSVSLAEGESATIDAVLRGGNPPVASADLDVTSGGRVATRARVEGTVLSQLEPSLWGFADIPVGSLVTLPVTLRNSSATARTIAAVTSDTLGVSLPDLVGTTMAPREVRSILATVDIGAPTTFDALLGVAFDSGPGSSMQLYGTIAAADFAVEAADGTPTDGWIDLGVVDLDAAPIDRAVVVRNFRSEPRTIFVCSLRVDGLEFVGGCPSAIPAGGSALLTIRFTPSQGRSSASYRGVLHSRLGIGMDGATTFIGVRAQLVEAGAPFLTVPEALDLGEAEIGETAIATVEVPNLGRLGAVVDRVEVDGAAFSFAEPLSYRIAAGGALAVDVGFAPSVEGAQAGELRLYVGGAAGPFATVALAGQGTAAGPADDGGDDGDGDMGDDSSGDVGDDGSGDGDDQAAGDGSDDGTSPGDDGPGGDEPEPGGCAVSGGGSRGAWDLASLGIGVLVAGARRRRRPRS